MTVTPAGDSAPQFTKNFVSVDYDPGNYWSLETPINADIKCRHENSTTGEFEQATTLQLDLTLHFNMNVTYSVLLQLEIFDLDLKYNGAIDSNISLQSAILIQQKLNLAVSIVVSTIANFFEKGISFSNIFYGTPLCWLNVDQIFLSPNYSNSFQWGGLTPEYMPSSCPNKNPYGAFDKELLHPKELLKQVAQNILADFMERWQEMQTQKHLDTLTKQLERADETAYFDLDQE